MFYTHSGLTLMMLHKSQNLAVHVGLSDRYLNTTILHICNRLGRSSELMKGEIMNVVNNKKM